MFLNSDISPSRRKLGIYRIGDLEYSNKYHALSNCSPGQYPEWDFNNEEFSKFDWSKEPTMDLYELYKLRAIQIRQKYENVLIYYSGGIDSTCVLRSFLDNDIKVDGVIMTGAWSLDKKDNMVTNQEQKLVGYPYLKEMLKKQKFPIHFLDTSKLHENFRDPSWIYTVGQSFSPQVYTYNFYYQDPWIQNFLMKGTTCFVRGVDKPRVVWDSRSNKWKSGFLDSQIMSGTPSGFLSTKQEWDIQEYFFWSPDLPELPIKQAHIVWNYIKNLVNAKELFDMHGKSKLDNYDYYKITDPLVYGKYVRQEVGGERTYFHIRKTKRPNLWPKDLWFFDDELKDEPWVKMWHQGIYEIEKKIDRFFYNDPKKPLAETNLVGCWSKMYDLESLDK